VLLDVDEHERGNAEAERLGIDRRGEAGDHTLVAQSLQPRVRRRSGDVDLLGEVRQRHSGVVRQRLEEGSIDAVDLSNRGRTILEVIDVLIHEQTIIDQIVMFGGIGSTFHLERAIIVV
jgi:hypothetical protein